ncbi:MAG TPA: GAF domain-containing SpoIIE family protein phosphatase [Actinomycetota bacterium]|nr:GAF domain-containing SpoIIE family protein phosphatase [Actinomycetota bacterium]
MRIEDPPIQSDADTAEQRYRFLLTASTMLSAALDFDSTIEALGRAAIPALGDVCLIDIADAGTFKRVAARAVDEELIGALETVSLVAGTPHPAILAAETGEMVIVTNATDYELQVIAGNERNFEMLKERNLRCCISVPIVARSCLGTLTVLTEGDQADERSETVPTMAEDLARRAALALDNAKLYESSRNMAITLQRSLMPAALPKVPGLDIAALYNAGGEGAEVGGDFYDVFPTGEGDEGWAAVIGDVCGKGAEAAALSALARHTIRAANVTLRKPRRILAFLNQLAMQDEYRRFITVAYCRMKFVDRALHITLGRAGHPPPLLLRQDGSVKAVGKPGTLIGVTPEPNLSDQVIKVFPGESLVLYTDGITEARGLEGQFGQERLEAELATCVGKNAQQILDHLEQAVEGFQTGRSHDDMAILVIRVDPDAAPGGDGT